eukprot:g9689.t1
MTYIPAFDRINLTPYEKYKKYNVFPFSTVFHMALLVCTTSFLILNTNRTGFRRSEADAMWAELLWSDVADIKSRHSGDFELWKANSYFISERRTLVRDVHNLVNEYFLLDRRTVDEWYVYNSREAHKTDTGSLRVSKPTYTVKRRIPTSDPSSAFDPGLSTYSIDVYPLSSPKIPGPLGVYKIVNGTTILSPELKSWLENVVSLDFDMSVATVVPRKTHLMSNPTRKWKINVHYNCDISGTITATLSARNVYHCSLSNKCTFLTFGSILLTVCVTLAFFYQLMIFRDLSFSVYILRRIQFEKPERYAQLQMSDVLTLLNAVQVLIASAGNIFFLIFYINVVTNAVIRQIYEASDSSSSLMLGISIACIWIDTTKYIRTEARYNTVFVTLQQASISIGYLLLGTLPIFIAYALFAYNFWGVENERFESLAETFVTLFAVLNGDEIHPTYVSLEAKSYQGGTIDSFLVEYCFMYSFIIFFTFIAARVCVSIIEDIYMQDYLSKKGNKGRGVKSSVTPALEDILNELDLEDSMHVK